MSFMECPLRFESDVGNGQTERRTSTLAQVARSGRWMQIVAIFIDVKNR
jgi:hypothetical protein